LTTRDKLRVRSHAADRIFERRHRNLRIDQATGDGDLLVTISCGSDKHGVPIDLLPWLYSWGAGVEVIAPEHVRLLVQDELRRAAAAYEDCED
jgi:predicted DNA-binding transcriptional regulator YafY